MLPAAVKGILKEIESLDAEDRACLETEMARRLDIQWKREVVQARRIARRRHIDQETIDRTILRRRYGQ